MTTRINISVPKAINVEFYISFEENLGNDKKFAKDLMRHLSTAATTDIVSACAGSKTLALFVSSGKTTQDHCHIYYYLFIIIGFIDTTK